MTLKIGGACLIVYLLSACVPLKNALNKTAETPLKPARSLKILLQDRQNLCADTPEHIDAQLAQWTQLKNPSAPEVNEQRLDALLLATCQPARTPGIFRQLLADHQTKSGWPQDYLAFFDLLNAQVKAYGTLDAVHQDLKTKHQTLIQTHQILVDEHQALIDDLGKIETDIQQKSEE